MFYTLSIGSIIIIYYCHFLLIYAELCSSYFPEPPPILTEVYHCMHISFVYYNAIWQAKLLYFYLSTNYLQKKFSETTILGNNRLPSTFVPF